MITDAQTVREPLSVVHRLQAATNAHDLDALVDCFSSDYLSEIPVHPSRTFRGDEQVRRNWSEILAGVPDFHSTLVREAVGGTRHSLPVSGPSAFGLRGGPRSGSAIARWRCLLQIARNQGRVAVFLTHRRLALVGHRLGPIVLAAGLTAGSLAGLAPTPTNADTCGDTCVVVPGTVQTPLGLVTVTASAANVVTVHLDPSAPNTLVFGVPFQLPPGPPILPGYARTTIDTSGGLVTIDTFQLPPGPPLRFALPNLAIISIHPPGPCRARTIGTTVTFTPILPPGPPI